MTREIRLGLFFVVALVILGVIFELLGGVPFLERRYSVSAYFKDVGELKVGNPVKLSGFEVGQISGIKIAGDKIRVDMTIKENTPVKRDSVATIRLTSLLGISYVNLTFGSPDSPNASDGDVLASEERADVNEILKKLEATVSSIDSVIGENKDRISNIIKGFDTIVTDALEGRGTLGKLVKDDSLYNELKDTFSSLSDISRSVKEGKGTLGKLVKDESLYDETKNSVAKLGEVADKISRSEGTMGKLISDDKLYREATEAATNLNEILKKINKGEGTVGKLVNEDALYNEAHDAVKKLNKGISTQEDLAPLQTLGTAFGIITIF